MNSMETFSQQFEEIRRRTALLRASRNDSAMVEPVLKEAVQELEVAYEELQVAEEELRQQEEQISVVNEAMVLERDRYLELFEMAPDGYLVTDPRGMIIEANKAAVEMLNVPQETLIGKPMVSYLSLDSRATFRCELNALMTADIQQEMEIVMQPRNGESFDAALRVSVIRGRDGNATALRWIMRDVTVRNRAADEIRRLNLELEGRIADRTRELHEANRDLQELLENERELRRVAEQAIADRDREESERKRAEAELRAREERFRALVENSWDAVALVMPDGTVLYTTPAIHQILGVSPATAVQRNLFEFLHPRDMNQVATLLDRVLMAPNLPVSGEFRHRHADGGWRWLEVTVTNMTDHQAVGAIVINYRDITSQRESAELLRRSERRFRYLFESNLIAIAFFSHDSTITDANNGFLKMLGATGEHLVSGNLNLLGMTPPEWAEQDTEATLQLAAYGYCSPYRKEIMRQDGARIPVLLGAAMFDRGDEGVCFVLDMTEQKSAEAERARLFEAERSARDDAENLIRSRDQFIAMVSHEIRTPLTPILAVMEELDLDRIPEDLHTELEIVLRNSRLAASLINDLLDNARIEREAMAVSAEPVDIHRILQETVESYTTEVRLKNLSISGRLEATEYCVLGDPQRLEQVFRNLLNNAVKFTPAGGTIAISTVNRGSSIVIECIDDGIGIDPENLPRIFDPFHKATHDSGRETGLGLGLAICRKIIELHDGTIEVESRGRGTGSCFRVTLDITE